MADQQVSEAKEKAEQTRKGQGEDLRLNGSMAFPQLKKRLGRTYFFSFQVPPFSHGFIHQDCQTPPVCRPLVYSILWRGSCLCLVASSQTATTWRQLLPTANLISGRSQQDIGCRVICRARSCWQLRFDPVLRQTTVEGPDKQASRTEGHLGPSLSTCDMHLVQGEAQTKVLTEFSS